MNEKAVFKKKKKKKRERIKHKTHHLGCVFIQKTWKLGLERVQLDIEFQIILKLKYKRNY